VSERYTGWIWLTMARLLQFVLYVWSSGTSPTWTRTHHLISHKWRSVGRLNVLCYNLYRCTSNTYIELRCRCLVDCVGGQVRTDPVMASQGLDLALEDSLHSSLASKTRKHHRHMLYFLFPCCSYTLTHRGLFASRPNPYTVIQEP